LQIKPNSPYIIKNHVFCDVMPMRRTAAAVAAVSVVHVV